MGTTLEPVEEGIAFVQRKLDARTHWLIVGASRMGLETIACIESEFYAGPEASGDFSLVVLLGIEGLPIGLATAHKRHMSPKQFAERAGIDEPSIQDVILTPDIPRSVLLWLVETFHSDSLN